MAPELEVDKGFIFTPGTQYTELGYQQITWAQSWATLCISYENARHFKAGRVT